MLRSCIGTGGAHGSAWRGRFCGLTRRTRVSAEPLAHTLALVAVAKGDQGAATSQKPYNQLISDALRTELGVPTQASQAEQLKTLQSPAPRK